MSTPLYPPFVRVFGAGAPGGSVPHNAMYFDTGTTPYTPYIYVSGAWQSFGGGSAGGNATSIQGKAVDPTAPTDGQALIFHTASNKYIPGDISASAPTIVQHGINSGTAPGTVTLGAAPTKGNLLVALFTHFSNNLVPNNPNAGLGWSNLSQTNGSLTDGYGVFYKIVGTGEAAAQTVMNGGSLGVVALWEIANFSGSVFDVFVGQHDLNATPTVTQSITTTGNNELLLALFATASNNTTGPTGISGFTQDDTVGANNRAGVSGHASAATAGTFNLSATWAANPTAVATCAIALA